MQVQTDNLSPEEEIKRICREVVARVRPDEAERREVKALTEFVIARLNEKAEEQGVEARAISVGSTARNTWVSGEADLDIFILFPPDLSEEDLKEQGLALAKSVVSGRYEERYASHPYIHAYLGAHEVDLVPCFAVKDAASLKSAVDRTPFHNEYVAERVQGLEEEVLLLKRFLKCRGIYGSEQRRKGFSGYLCELLILKYSSFVGLLKNASRWRFGERIEIEGRGKYKDRDRNKEKEKDALVVIDPVDPNRNVAAVVSLDSFCRLIDAARDFLACPDASFFSLPSEAPAKAKAKAKAKEEREMSRAEFLKCVEERGTEFVMVLFEAPAVVEDVLFPQLRKAEASVARLLQREEFEVFRSDISVAVSAAGEKAFLVFELLVWQLPRVKKHLGPPVTSKHHAEQFKKKYIKLRIENGRYVVEVPRKYTDAVELLKNELGSCGLGKDVRGAVERGYEVLRNEEIKFFPGVGSFFKKYFG